MMAFVSKAAVQEGERVSMSSMPAVFRCPRASSTWTLLLLAFLLAGCGRKVTYAQGCGPLPANWIKPRDGRDIFSLLDVIRVAADHTKYFNGTKVSEATFRDYLTQSRGLNPKPVTQVIFDPALDCRTVANVREVVSDDFDCDHGHCAERSGEWWIISDVGSGLHRFPEHLIPPFEAAN
jgi:hypothetical protein